MTAKKELPGCAEKVVPSGRLLSVPCSRKGHLRHEGKWYCKQHHPPEIKRKRDAEEERWRKESNAIQKRRNLESAAPDMLEALKAFRQVSDQDWGDDAIQAGFAPSIMLGSAIEKAKDAIAKAEGRDNDA